MAHSECRLAGMTPVVKNLIIINIVVFAAQYLLEHSGIQVENLFALHYVRSEHFHSWQIITHMFMHANLQHILFNMLPCICSVSLLRISWGRSVFSYFTSYVV